MSSDCEKIIMYTGEMDSNQDGQDWAQNNVYSLKHIAPTLMHWWKFHGPTPSEGDAVTFDDLKKNTRGDEVNASVERKQVLNECVALGFLDFDDGTYTITAEGIEFMLLHFPQQWVDEEIGGDFQNLFNDKDGGCYQKNKRDPRLDWSQSQRNFIISRLLDACFDADMKMVILKELRFIRFNQGRWMPKPGNVNRVDWNGNQAQRGLFYTLFRKPGLENTGINNTVSQTGIWCEEMGLIRTLETTTGPGRDVELTDAGEEVYRRLEMQFEENRSMPFVRDRRYTMTARKGTDVGRIYLQDRNLRNAGFSDGTAIDVVYGDNRVTITPRADGDNATNHVSGQKQTGSEQRIEVIDIRSNELNETLGDPGDDVKYTIYPFKIIVEQL